MAWNCRISDDGLGVLIESDDGGSAELVVYFAVPAADAKLVETVFQEICDKHNESVGDGE